MFDIGVGEILVLLVVALLVFGPERLPTMAKQAASWVRDLRVMVANARRDLSDSVGDLGVDQNDLKTLADLRNPKSFVRRSVLDGVDLGLDDLDDKPLSTPIPPRARNGSRPRAATTAGPAGPAEPDDPAQPPPFDPDAT